VWFRVSRKCSRDDGQNSLLIEYDLLGTIRLVRNWGRIGTSGREIVEVFADGIEAGQALEMLAREKRRRGYRDL
jgi:predicted DNA-binding WGR domain protein